MHLCVNQSIFKNAKQIYIKITYIQIPTQQYICLIYFY